jgi:hypothetical protein
MKESSLPIACTLTPAEFQSMREGLLPGLLAKASEKEAIRSGFRWKFDFEQNLVKEAASVMETEHRCCKFLRFVLTVEPDDGPVWLEVTGPQGTEEFLSALTGSTSPNLSPEL